MLKQPDSMFKLALPLTCAPMPVFYMLPVVPTWIRKLLAL